MNRLCLLPLLLTVLLPSGAVYAGDFGHVPAGAAAVGELEDALLLSVDGSIVIEADGSVGEYAIASKTTPELMDMFARAIPRWRFDPVLVDGQPRRAKANMRLLVAATKAGKDYRVGIENVVFPGVLTELDGPRASAGAPVEAIGRKMTPPTYPRALERAGVTGRVLLGMHFAPDGRILEVVPVQTMLFSVRGFNAELRKAVALLESSATGAARQWTIDVKQRPGVPTTERDFTAYTTIEYVMSGPTRGKAPRGKPEHVSNDAPPGQWRQATRTAKRPMPWLAGLETPDIGVADVNGGEMLPLSGGPTLKTPLATGAH
jgi:hypothetical protein